MTVRERIREQPLPGEAEAAARSWPVVEAALAAQTPAARAAAAAAWRSASRSWRRPCAWASSRRSRPPAPRWATGSATASPTGRPGTARLRGPAAGASVLAISRSGAYAVHAGRRRAARLVLRRGLVAARAERGGSRRPARGRGEHRRDTQQVVGHAARARAPSRLEHRPRLLRGVPRGRRAAHRGRRRRRATDRCAARAAPVTPAWRPHGDHVLVYARERGGARGGGRGRAARRSGARGGSAALAPDAPARVVARRPAARGALASRG